MPQPYIKKLQTYRKINIWQVDGNYIRNKIDVNFNNSGHHYSFKFIPENEIWIDKDFSCRGDEDLLAQQSIIERKLMKHGMEYTKATVQAGNKLKKIRKELNKIPIKDVYNHVHVKLLKKYSINGIKVWVINGRLVRDTFYLYYTEGGHHYVYDFVPLNEVWLDDSLNPKEYGYVLFHELIERNLMKYNKMTYNHAHDVAIRYEGSIRSNKIDPEPLIFEQLNRKK